MPEPVLRTLIRFHEEANRRYGLVPIRYKPLDAQNAYEGDYDYLCDPETLDDILRLLHTYCHQERLHCLIDRRKPFKTLVTLHSTDSNRTALIEIWTLLDVKASGFSPAIAYRDAPLVYEEKRWRLHRAFEALYYLSHLKSKRKSLDTPLVALRCRHYAKIENWPEIARLYDALLSGKIDIDEAGRQANALLHSRGWLKKTDSIDTWLAARRFKAALGAYRLATRLLRQIGFIPVVGPDGVGKTTFINRLTQRTEGRYYRFKRLYRRSLLYGLLNLIDYDPTEEEKNVADERHGLWLYLIAVARFPFLAAKASLTGRRHYADRYFYDLLLQNVRQKGTPDFRPRWRRLLPLMPRPYALIQLDATTETILRRKNELTREGIDLYRTALFTFYLRKPSRLYAYIRTDASLEEAVDFVAKGLSC